MVCKRSWALIYLEDLWLDNWRTISGTIMHQRVHNSELIEKRSNAISTHALKICSHNLGLSGETDLVEFIKNKNGITITGYPDKYIPYPIEYKRGTGISLEADSIQLCAQAICLEEMLNCKIEKGAIYYGELRKRKEVIFDESLRENVKNLISDIKEIIKSNKTPPIIKNGFCKECSLKNQCLPKLKKMNVVNYLNKFLTEDTNA